MDCRKSNRLLRQSLFHPFRAPTEWRVLNTNNSLRRQPSGCVTKRPEVYTMRRNSGRPACDFVRSACGSGDSAVRAALVHNSERLYRSRSRRKHSFIHTYFQNSTFDLMIFAGTPPVTVFGGHFTLLRNTDTRFLFYHILISFFSPSFIFPVTAKIKSIQFQMTTPKIKTAPVILPAI